MVGQGWTGREEVEERRRGEARQGKEGRRVPLDAWFDAPKSSAPRTLSVPVWCSSSLHSIVSRSRDTPRKALKTTRFRLFRSSLSSPGLPSPPLSRSLSLFDSWTHMSALKVLVTGPAPSLSAYTAKLASLQAKHSFDLVLALDLFAHVTDDDEDLDQLLKGQLKVPVQVYAAQGKGSLPPRLKDRVDRGEELTSNLSVLRASLLAVPWLSQRNSPHHTTQPRPVSSPWRRASASRPSRAPRPRPPTRPPLSPTPRSRASSRPSPRPRPTRPCPLLRPSPSTSSSLTSSPRPSRSSPPSLSSPPPPPPPPPSPRASPRREATSRASPTRSSPPSSTTSPALRAQSTTLSTRPRPSGSASRSSGLGRRGRARRARGASAGL